MQAILGSDEDDLRGRDRSWVPQLDVVEAIGSRVALSLCALMPAAQRACRYAPERGRPKERPGWVEGTQGGDPDLGPVGSLPRWSTSAFAHFVRKSRPSTPTISVSRQLRRSGFWPNPPLPADRQ